MSDTEVLDERMAFLSAPICSSLKVKPDKVRKMFTTDEYRTTFLQFLESSSQMKVCVYTNLKDDLEPVLGFPASLKKKAVVFVKKAVLGNLTLDAVKKEVIILDLAPNTLEQLAALLEHVYLPLLMNERNREAWPEVMVQDLLRHVQRLIATTQVTIGQTKGKTLLPLPVQEGAESSDAVDADAASKDKSVVHGLESIVVNWMRQIRAVLKSDFEAPPMSKLGPSAELDFWEKKEANLRSIFEQLKSERVMKVCKILNLSRSQYYPAFRKVQGEVVEALRQCHDINRYLSVLRRHIDVISSTEPSELHKSFEPTLHAIGLVWTNCKNYQSPARLVVLLRLLCNSVIDQIVASVDPKNIFSMEAPEAVERLAVGKRVCAQYRAAFLKYRNWFNGKYPAFAWKFDVHSVFGRFDGFEARVGEIDDIVNAAVEFNRLERVEVGGTKGVILSAQVQQIFKEFTEAVSVFQNLDYDPIDLTLPRFGQDFATFRTRLRDLESRVGAILVQGFDDCSSVYNVFKLLDSFDSLVKRESIRKDIETRYSRLIHMIDEEIADVHRIFLKQHDAPPIYNNMPAVAGTLSWSRGLLNRISVPMEKLAALGGAAVEGDEGRELQKMYAGVVKLLSEFEHDQHSRWTASIDSESEAKLKENLLVRDPDTLLLRVNFDSVLVRLLREAKYFQSLQLNIPEALQRLHQKSDFYYSVTTKLEMAVSAYNADLKAVLPVERALLQAKIEAVDQLAEKGVMHLNWRSPGIQEYIDQISQQIHELHSILQSTNAALDEIQKILGSWSTAPLIERKDAKKIMKMSEETAKVEKRCTEISQGGAAIQKLLLRINELFGVGKASPNWLDYVQYVNEKVVAGFVHLVTNSADYLLKHMDASMLQHSRRGDVNVARQFSFLQKARSTKLETPPLFEVEMTIEENDVVFNPMLEGENDSLSESISRWVRMAIDTTMHMRRLDNNDEDYWVEVSEIEPVLERTDRIVVLLHETVQRCLEYRDQFLKYSFLWLSDREKALKDFLKSGGSVRAVAAAKKAAAEAGVEYTPPSDDVIMAVAPGLEDFDEVLAKYGGLLHEIEAMTPSCNFQWLRVVSKPVQRAVAAEARRWHSMFTDHVLGKVTNDVEEMRQFVSGANAGMDVEVPKGNYDVLVGVMNWLLSVRQRQATTDVMWEPLKANIRLLAKHNVQVDASITQTIEELQPAWELLKKRSEVVRAGLREHMAIEVDKALRAEDAFRSTVMDFRQAFKTEAPFLFEVAEATAYERIDSSRAKVIAKQQEEAKLAKELMLFELPVRKFDMVEDCYQELSLLKSVWDMISLVKAQVNEWKETLWKDINTDAMEDAAKKFSKEIRMINKRAKAWDCYTGLENYVKNFLTTLPLVGELKSPSMRPRHWKQLMQATNMEFTIGPEFKLEDLMQLNLHNFVDDVNTIVDRANKELNMEKVLTALDDTWKQQLFAFGAHSSGCPLLQVGEELLEHLEDDTVLLQNQMASKFIAHFYDDFYSWKMKLSTVDAVISVWLEVQRTWEHLESIFIGSADIRAQLPNDSKLFDSIDGEWKELMGKSVGVPNAVECCNQAGLLEKLEELQGKLAICEKALADYLETKRRIFPRFYFISSPDLLDILSKGNNPIEVMKHMPKLSDNIGKLEFEQEEGGAFTKNCVGMYSREGEYVPFHEPCLCSGPVEEWLNKLIDAMRKTLRHILAEAVQAYATKDTRLGWIREFPAQIALVGVQIYWNVEVGESFDKLEDGNEFALKEYNKQQNDQLIELITAIQGKLDKQDRMKIMTICTIDVHSKDIVARLVSEKAGSSSCFSWQSQLRHRWDDGQGNCFVNICDAQFCYAYEYLGNAPRLVITPLTDRCYITLTQSLHLKMGGAPAGPAGTGKTETTKDLGRSLGVMVYVFNCSEQMDYKSLGNIFKGLSSSGSWGCFDEFNRIAIEVLSVVATQVKSILDALREKKARFEFQGEEIGLVTTVGMFITMNPGYAGRTELPENLKALYRPVSMVVPDLGLICEIMLVAEGFIYARELAVKFTTLYKLCADLLSKQDHYDWGLRAIKAVLVVAGELKRAELEVPEEHVLMRALRDFNTPKIVTEDVAVFLGLIGDLFPGVNLLRKRDEELESVIRKVSEAAHLQTSDEMCNFVLKIVQLHELLAVRHSVFVIGPSGSGKTEVWKMLGKAWTARGRKTVYQDLNPKAVTQHELFGYINMQTREWKDGLFSIVMRDFANHPSTDPKWIVLDGDVDPEWIESLNTVMDDNKVLTLASNERIPLHPHMRLIFEIHTLKYANPSTVSRAGILFINETDVGWRPYVESWLANRPNSHQKILRELIDKYVPTALETTHSTFKNATPISRFNKVQTLINILTGLLTETNVHDDVSPEIMERYFYFAGIWSFGGCLFMDSQVDYREQFNKWWRVEFKSVKLPEGASVFDVFVDHKTKEWRLWNEIVPEFVFQPETALSSILVHTVETTRLRYLMDVFRSIERPVLLVGPAGCGKTAIIREMLETLNADEWTSTTINFNFYSDSMGLQTSLEAPLEKKTQKTFGPPGSRKLIYFVDDLNIPEVDIYGTQAPITVLRQHMDYKHWYDRGKMTIKEILNVMFFAAMNPTAGSFTVNPRLQRHFGTFGCYFPAPDNVQSIYTKVVQGHFKHAGFQTSFQTLAEKLIVAAVDLHRRVTSNFLPTAIIFHYQFNLRDLTNIFGGVMLAKPDTFKSATDVLRLYVHEAERVYADRLVNSVHLKKYAGLLELVIKDHFADLDTDELLSHRPVVCHFARGLTEKVYTTVPSDAQLKRVLEEALDQYNEDNAVMDLVLFEDAMRHVARISRIIECPRGSALLVGVGGSGKQSLARLAAYISQYTVVQITISKTYGVNDLKLDLNQMYMKAGVKNMGLLFLFTDTQIVDEHFLVYINDMLATGHLTGVFTDEDKENVVNSLRSEVKALGIVDSVENVWNFFIDKVRRNLHVCLCFSPVGDMFRVRARKFPALVSCSMIDWFHPWPHDALLSVAKRFMADVEIGSDDVRENVVAFMAFAQKSVNEASEQYAVNEKRYNYTTPKSFLELISLYKAMLAKKRKEIEESIERLESGLIKLQSTTDDVEKLKAELKIQQVEVERKRKAADELLERVAKETNIVQGEQAKAAVEEEKCSIKAKEVSEKQAACAKELEKAEPIVQKALAALNTLNKANLTELKAFTKPAAEVELVIKAVMILIAPGGKVPKDLSWNGSKKSMGSADQFLAALQTYDKENIPAEILKAVRPLVEGENFNGDFIKSKSVAAAGLCEWAKNIVAYYDVYCFVQPLREALDAANQELETSRAILTAIQSELEKLNSRLKELTDEFEQASEEKNRVIAQAQATEKRLDLANRLVGGLSSENERWGKSVDSLKQNESVLVGDVLLAAAFVSYIGAFDRVYREELVHEKWLPYMREHALPMSEGLTNPASLLTSDAEIARWNNEGLPTDAISIQNATIVTTCARWPLLIDPQLQAWKWIRQRETPNDLVIIRLTQPKYLDSMERAIQDGLPVLIENIGESVDAVLDPVIGRQITRKGRNLFIKLGDKEVDYHKNFRLFLQTKMGNPHYKPEIQAQATLINFTVTEKGLEEQLLALVVNKERPDLESTKTELLRQQNEFKIRLKELEDDLLTRLAHATGDILSDTSLIENLEKTKLTAVEIEAKVIDARETAKNIDIARERYRPAAERSSMLYFLLNDLWKIDAFYQFSLKAFTTVFYRAIDAAPKSDDLKARVDALIDFITFTVFSYTSRGLFERHKLIFSFQLTAKIFSRRGELDLVELDFLLRGKQVPTDKENPFSEFVSDEGYRMLLALKELEAFNRLLADIEASPKRWKEWCEYEKPEEEKLPADWKNKNSLQRLCIMRCLRPDRLSYAMRLFVEEFMGQRFVDALPNDLAAIFEETTPTTPLIFVLSPGSDPVKELEILGKKLGYTEDNKKYRNVSLGQGQEIVAERAIEAMYAAGGWVMLQNIHLTKRWLSALEKKIEGIAEHYEKLEADAVGDYQHFRLFLSAEPSPDPTTPSVQPGILQACIKVTNEPPAGMRANMRRAFANFNQEVLESCSKQNEFKSILFTLCFFHAAILERRKFGPQGWNIPYNFNTGDLTISIDVLFNYLESNSVVPWDDLRYMFGEIMYGGHISDDWDRRLCGTYLERLVRPALLEDGMELAPQFPAPPSGSYADYKAYIEEGLPAESPVLFGLHPNAEIGFLTQQSSSMFATILSLQPKQGATGTGLTRDERVMEIINEILDKLPEVFDMYEMYQKIGDGEQTPYISVCLQECERMNILLAEMRRSLKELALGINGDLTMSDRMEQLLVSLFVDQVPAAWNRVAYPSMKSLALWFDDLLLRLRQLEAWQTDLNLPVSVWLSGLFNPQSFLTAIMQTTARKNQWPLDKMCLVTEVTKRTREDVGPPPKEGAYVHGLFLEGARWDTTSGMLKDSIMKELFPEMPVVNLRAVTKDKAETRDIYQCPVYKIRRRGPTYVWTFNIKTKEREFKWVLAGVAILLSL